VEKYEILDTLFQVFGHFFQVLDTSFQVLDTFFQVLDTFFQVLDTVFQVAHLTPIPRINPVESIIADYFEALIVNRAQYRLHCFLINLRYDIHLFARKK
jgi:hypothetical protein